MTLSHAILANCEKQLNKASERLKRVTDVKRKPLSSVFECMTDATFAWDSRDQH